MVDEGAQVFKLVREVDTFFIREVNVAWGVIFCALFSGIFDGGGSTSLLIFICIFGPQHALLSQISQNDLGWLLLPFLGRIC
jgi:hypothetical protein